MRSISRVIYRSSKVLCEVNSDWANMHAWMSHVVTVEPDAFLPFIRLSPYSSFPGCIHHCHPPEYEKVIRTADTMTMWIFPGPYTSQYKRRRTSFLLYLIWLLHISAQLKCDISCRAEGFGRHIGAMSAFNLPRALQRIVACSIFGIILYTISFSSMESLMSVLSEFGTLTRRIPKPTQSPSPASTSPPPNALPSSPISPTP